MKVFGSAALWLFVGLVLAGCASAKVKELKPLQGKVQRPERIIVYDFAAAAPELRPEVAVAGEGAVSPPATQLRLVLGRKLGEKTAKGLLSRTAGLCHMRCLAS